MFAPLMLIPSPVRACPPRYVPYFLSLYVEGGLIALDAATVQRMRPQRRVLLVRFIARALLNPFYHPEWVKAAMPGVCVWGGGGALQSGGGGAPPGFFPPDPAPIISASIWPPSPPPPPSWDQPGKQPHSTTP